MAGDIYHNFTVPEDSDGNGSIDPLDALVIINQLNGEANSSVSTPHRSQQLLDVDGDRALTPLDALVVINYLNLSDGDFSRTVRESRVNSERRIERIEWSIANDHLPPGMTIENALNILATLRSGGRPELGDRIVDGLVRNSIETSRVENATVRKSGEPMGTPAIRKSGVDLGVDEESISPGNNRVDSTKPQLRTSANEARTNLLSEQQRDNLAQLRSDLEAVIANSGVTSEMIQQLANDLLVLIDGATRPSKDSVAQLLTTIQSCLADGAITLPERLKITADLKVVLESANVPISEMNAVIADLKAILSASGITQETISTIVNDIRAIISELQNNRTKRTK